MEYEWYLGTSLGGHKALAQPRNDVGLPVAADKDFTVQDLAMLQFKARLTKHIRNVEELWASIGWFAKKYYGPPPAIVTANGAGPDYWKAVLRDHETELRSMLRR
jgi:hypothetical protein